MLSHRNADAFVGWAARASWRSGNRRLSSHAPLHFDLSIFDLFAAVRSGAAVALVPSGLSPAPIELARWIGQSAITVWYSVPSALTMLLLRGRLDDAGLSALRTILFAGEVFPTKHLHRLMQLLSHVRFATSTARPKRTSARGTRSRWPDEPVDVLDRDHARAEAAEESLRRARLRLEPHRLQRRDDAPVAHHRAEHRHRLVDGADRQRRLAEAPGTAPSSEGASCETCTSAIACALSARHAPRRCSSWTLPSESASVRGSPATSLSKVGHRRA